jgi:hypothetical protein
MGKRGEEMLGNGWGAAMAHGQKFGVVNDRSVQPHEQYGIQRGQNLGDNRRSGRTVMDDLASGAGNIRFGSRRRLDEGIVHPQAMIRRQGLAVPVKHGDPQQVNLEKHQQAGGKRAPNFWEPITRHDTPLYNKFYETGYVTLQYFGARGLSIDDGRTRSVVPVNLLSPGMVRSRGTFQAGGRGARMET